MLVLILNYCYFVLVFHFPFYWLATRPCVPCCHIGLAFRFVSLYFTIWNAVHSYFHYNLTNSGEIITAAVSDAFSFTVAMCQVNKGQRGGAVLTIE